MTALVHHWCVYRRKGGGQSWQKPALSCCGAECPVRIPATSYHLPTTDEVTCPECQRIIAYFTMLKLDPELHLNNARKQVPGCYGSLYHCPLYRRQP